MSQDDPPASGRNPKDDPLLHAVPEAEGYKVLDRRYVLFDTLGQGGMGVVYHGRHLRLDFDVAVKCLDPGMARRDPQFIQRFEKEGRSAVKVDHPNVVRVYDVSEASGLHFLVMQYVRGENARERVQRKGKLAVDEAVQIALGAARGLAAAHKVGLIHRDIKPDNILVSTDGEVKLADLGLAKMAGVESNMTYTGMAMGTPQYMSPEQIRDSKSVDSRSDVYALGATLYYLLTGTDGVARGSIADVIYRVENDPFPDVRELRADVSEELAKLIQRCVEKDPLQRPADAGEVAAALDQVADLGSARDLRDESAGTEVTMPLVSPPPEKTLAMIKKQAASSGDEPKGKAATLVLGPNRTLQCGVTVAIAGFAAVTLGAALWLPGQFRSSREATRVAQGPEGGSDGSVAPETPDGEPAPADPKPVDERGGPKSGDPTARAIPRVAELSLPDDSLVNNHILAVSGRIEGQAAALRVYVDGHKKNEFKIRPDEDGSFRVDVALPLKDGQYLVRVADRDELLESRRVTLDRKAPSGTFDVVGEEPFALEDGIPLAIRLDQDETVRVHAPDGKDLGEVAAGGDGVVEWTPAEEGEYVRLKVVDLAGNEAYLERAGGAAIQLFSRTARIAGLRDKRPDKLGWPGAKDPEERGAFARDWESEVRATAGLREEDREGLLDDPEWASEKKALEEAASPSRTFLTRLTADGLSDAERSAIWVEVREEGLQEKVIRLLEDRAVQATTPEPHVDLALAYLEKRDVLVERRDINAGSYELKALKSLDHALELDERHWRARYHKAMTLFGMDRSLGRERAAAEEFDLLIQIQEQGEPRDGYEAAYIHLGDLYDRIGQRLKAKETWQRGADLFPDDPELRKRLGS